ncbi:hypothetical protein KJ359_007565 [Pestalotiopsis sp. 9143b]|nr:hypothetical protein KJ359_007565 [Pestalotiopsis sp. 9143b]
MRFAEFITIFAAAAFGAPTDSGLNKRSWTSPETGLHVRGLGYQGDGFYLAVFNESGVADVQFTPMEDLNATTPAGDISRRDDDGNALAKRAGTTCSGKYSGNQANLNWANWKLASNADAVHNYGFHAWGWVHDQAETSYFCNYQANYLTYQLVSDMQTVVSDKCGQSAYGFDRRTNGGGANDLAVGRTWYDSDFCESGFKG